MLARPPRPFPASPFAPRAGTRRPVVVVRRRPWRRLVAVVRGLAARSVREWEIASRLNISQRLVRLALSEGAGIWTPEQMARMRAAWKAEAGR
ncbi:hypothetical protein FHS55_002146 [Angulomicrobium tetraedrale]|uniref:Uncharacterized protein n=1 Tax=Ancylobacter tetraedralis TaxID=217068 RepID=A0A839Z9Z7_9HYPH|nr:hypothetical protein [Ancylobacter tetraedralis]MBB3771547.1 hypothetical protein [Ancylobacter tetraedralis]